MVAQIIEGWKKIWEGIQQSREQKHRRMLENFKMVDLKEYKEEIQEQCQIRFEQSGWLKEGEKEEEEEVDF